MKFFIMDVNSVLLDVAEELINRGHTLIDCQADDLEALKEADKLVIWNETTLGGWREWIVQVQGMGKKVILVQHGRRGCARVYPPFNEKILSDVVLVWGEAQKQRLLKYE